MVETRVEVLGWLREQLEKADVDLLRQMVESVVGVLMSAEADNSCRLPRGLLRAARGE